MSCCFSHAAFQGYKLEENMSLAKEGLEKGMKEVNEGELKRSPGGLCCIKLAAAKLQWRDGFQVNHYSI